MDYLYPTSGEITQVMQNLLPDLTMNDPLFQVMPINESDAHILEWDQMDDYRGMQQLRGLNGDPAVVANVGGKHFMVEPGVYGEWIAIDEKEITVRRKFGTYNTPITIDDLVMQKSEQLLHRRIKRLKYVGWQVLVYGTFTILAPNGAVAHQDSYLTQNYVSTTPWINAGTSTPLQDLRNMQQLSLGKSASFGSNARMFANRVTANYMLRNTNPADLGGRRGPGLSNLLSMKMIGEVLMGEDLPNLEIYDGGYADEFGTFQRYIPTGTVVIVGQRDDGSDIMEYRMTRNAQNPGAAPGPYTQVMDNQGREVPRQIKVHDGHNGGPVVYFPGAIVTMRV